MAHSRSKNHFLNQLRIHFKPNYHYLITRKSTAEINSYFRTVFYGQALAGHKKTLWGNQSNLISAIGRKLGWVPNHLDYIFLSDSVLEEIAESISISRDELTASDTDREKARYLLKQMNIEHLANRNPFFLSAGETKLCWLLSQWAKQPEFILIENISLNLSQIRLNSVLDFLNDASVHGNALQLKTPVIIVNLDSSQQHLFLQRLNPHNWKILDE